MNIGEKLKELRIQRNLTQEELADRCELSKGFISQVERDLASPSIATLTDMLECLGSSLKEFFSDDSAEKVVYAPQDMFEKEEDGQEDHLAGARRSAQQHGTHPAGAAARRPEATSFRRWKARNSAMCCTDR